MLRFPTFFVAAAVTTCLGACHSQQEWSRVVSDRDNLARRVRQLEQHVARQEADAAELRRQKETLQGLPPDRPVDLFAAASMDIVSRSGGTDFDGKPGDDGVTLYLRPKDAEGDVVKVSGRITVQLLDNADPNSPQVVAVCTLATADELRAAWHGKFATDHYTIKCPFSTQAKLPKSETLLANVSFTDYLTGRTLLASQIVSSNSNRTDQAHNRILRLSTARALSDPAPVGKPAVAHVFAIRRELKDPEDHGESLAVRRPRRYTLPASCESNPYRDREGTAYLELDSPVP